MNELLERYRVLVTPTTGRIAPKIHDRWEVMVPTMEYAAATIIVNATGLTAASIPCGFVEGMPVGLQVIGARGDEATVLRIAQAFEQRSPWAARRPAL
jgi:Asp-tRNA(Asn)/Glu-tRNA(Gln) amidotransferase A subunit family amidase